MRDMQGRGEDIVWERSSSNKFSIYSLEIIVLMLLY